MRNNNQILLHKKNGKICKVFFITGLDIQFKGKNSIVEIWEPVRFVKKFGSKKSVIKIDGDNNYVQIKPTIHSIYSLKINGIKDNNKILIGENLYQTGACKIEFTGLSNLIFEIGDNCMLGQDVNFLLGDYHKIFDNITNKQINIPKKGIKLGNNIWVARDVKIMKDVSIASNSVVATGSIVTKSFEQENILISGIPAKILKENINWSI